MFKRREVKIMKNKNILIGAGMALITLFFVVVPVLGAPSFTLFGGATNVAGEISLVSNTGNIDASDDYSGVRFDGLLPTTLANLTMLSSDYNVTDDDCGG